MAELEIKGTKKYIAYMSKHLRKEHPSTKTRMEVELNGGRKNMKTKVMKVKKVNLGNTEFVNKDLLKKPKMEKVMSDKIPKKLKAY